MLDDEDLVSCVQCGLCLPHCPTFRVTGEESASPRGRIALMRQVQWSNAPADDAFMGYMDACVQCRACETACPAGVPFGHLMEGTRQTLVEQQRAYQPWWRRAGYRSLAHHGLVLAGSKALALAQRARVVSPARSRRLGLPEKLPVRQRALRASGTDVWMFTGCVMDAWQREVHEATQRVIESTGAGVALPATARGAGCCGALPVHAGLVSDARVMAQRVMASMPGEAPIVVDSAGCGAALKDYGRLLATDEAAALSARVQDVHEWVAARVELLPPARRAAAGGRAVAVQDPCHLRHVQRAHPHVRTVLAPYVAEMVELDDEGLCCGAGGAYAALHAELAGDIRERKVAAIRRTGATVVASANPGCMIHLANAGAGLEVRHPMSLIDEALR
jgi:glycolate oxidase iron-sulfur subunit